MRFAIAMQSARFLFSRVVVGGGGGCVGRRGRLTSKPTTRPGERAGTAKRGGEGGKQTSKMKPFPPISLGRLSSKQTKTAGTFLLHTLGFFCCCSSFFLGSFFLQAEGGGAKELDSGVSK